MKTILVDKHTDQLEKYPLTTDVEDDLELKVDKEAPKGLSTNDFTDVYKANVEANNLKVSFPEAPIDDFEYIRKNGDWSKVTSLGGQDGDSAYEIAIALGFIGTEAQWLESLIGLKGDKPSHQWSGTELRFENPDGSWGDYVDLKSSSLLADFTEDSTHRLITDAERTAWNAKQNALNISQYFVPYRSLAGSGGPDASIKVVQLSAEANTMARRTGAGAIYTGTPTTGDHATTKNYVDGILVGSPYLGTARPHTAPNTNTAPMNVSVFKMNSKAIFDSIASFAGQRDYFYLADKNSSYTVTATNCTGVNNLFNGAMDSDINIPVADLINNPCVITIEYNATINYTDVLDLIFTGHRLGANGATLTSWKVETKGSDNNWYTELDRDGVSDSVGVISIPLHVVGNTYPDSMPNNWHSIKGIRLTIRGATEVSYSPGNLQFSSLQLRESRPASKPALALGALDIGGGDMFGDTNWRYGVPKVAGNTMWHAGNDGVDSGLDADKLDGQEGSYYSNYTNLSNKPDIPTSLSELTDDSTHRIITDAERISWNGKQDNLISGTNIKTINGNSILGTGDIVITVGSSNASDIEYDNLVSLLIATNVQDAIDELNTNIKNIELTPGPKGDPGDPGGPGDKGDTGPGVPVGGTNGQILSKIDNTDYNTQWVNPPLTEAYITALIDAKILADNQAKYYVGKIIMDTANVDPNTYLGFGTWVLWGSGRVPVGVDINDADFNTVEKTGGNKTYALVAHTHPSAAHVHTSAQHLHGAGTLFAQINHHDGAFYFVEGNVSYTSTGRGTATGANDSTAQSQGVPIIGSTANTTPGNTGSTTPADTGSDGDATIDIQQKFITCYMWKRTA